MFRIVYLLTELISYTGKYQLDAYSAGSNFSPLERG